MALIRYFCALIIVILCVSGTFSKPRITPRIYGGTVAERDQFPFIVSIRAKDNSSNAFVHICGGTILSSRLILTAAHCTAYSGRDVNEYRVYVGARCKSSGHEHELKRLLPHRQSISDLKNPLFLENDLMFIELVKPIQFTNCIQPATIAREKVSDGVRVLAAGMGQTNDKVTSLKIVELETITNFQCVAKLTEITSTPPVHKSVVCARGLKIGDGICDGDSGGPLVTLDNKLVGVSSWAFDCGSIYPNGFQRLSSFIKWIDEVMASVEKS